MGYQEELCGRVGPEEILALGSGNKQRSQKQKDSEDTSEHGRWSQLGEEMENT